MSNQITHVSRTARHVSHRGQPSRLSLRAFRPRGCSRARRPQRQAKRMPHLPGRPGRAHCFALLSHGCFFTLNLNPTPSQKCDEHSIFAPPNRHTLLLTLTFLALTHAARMVHRCSLVRDGLVATISEMPLVDREAWSFFSSLPARQLEHCCGVRVWKPGFPAACKRSKKLRTRFARAATSAPKRAARVIQINTIRGIVRSTAR